MTRREEPDSNPGARYLLLPDCACGHGAVLHAGDPDEPACDAAGCPCEWWYEGRSDRDEATD